MAKSKKMHKLKISEDQKTYQVMKLLLLIGCIIMTAVITFSTNTQNSANLFDQVLQAAIIFSGLYLIGYWHLHMRPNRYNSQEIRNLYEEAEKNYDNEKYGEAISCYQKILKLNPFEMMARECKKDTLYMKSINKNSKTKNK